MGEIHVQNGCKPFKSERDKVAYARQQINCLPGFTPAPDHAILKCEGYVHITEQKKFEMAEFLTWLDKHR